MSVAYEDLVTCAVNCIDNNEYDMAIQKIHEAILLNDTDASLYLILADGYFGKLEEAVLNKAIDKQTPEYYKAVMDNCNKALELDPKLARANVILAKTYYLGSLSDFETSKEFYEKSVANYEHAIESDPDNAYQYHLALGYLHTGDNNLGLVEFYNACDQAIYHFATALSLKSDLHEAYEALGDVYLNKSLYEMELAEHYYEKAEEMDSDNQVIIKKLEKIHRMLDHT